MRRSIRTRSMRADDHRRRLPAALLCAVLLGACFASTGEDELVYVFVDLTEVEENGNDASYLESSIDPLLRLLGHGDDQDNRKGASVHIFPIYDFPLSKPVTAHLERGSRNQNALDRRDAVTRFEEELRAGIRSVVETNLKQRPANETYRQSHIFGPVCAGLKEIQRQGTPQNDRRVVIFSDMLENSPLASFYRGDLARASLIDDLEARCVLPDLSGICMNIVFQPMKAKSDLVLEAKSFWTGLFQSKGLETATPACFSYDAYL